MHTELATYPDNWQEPNTPRPTLADAMEWFAEHGASADPLHIARYEDAEGQVIAFTSPLLIGSDGKPQPIRA